MIKINVKNMDSIAENYFKIVYPKIKKRYTKYKSQFGQCGKIFASKDEEIDEGIIRYIITKPVSEIIKSDIGAFLFSFCKYRLKKCSDIYFTDKQNNNIKKIAKYRSKGHIEKTFKFLKCIFDYSIISPELRHELLYKFEVPVCPYCNRQYISNYIEEGSKKVTADLDHYYCKDEFPFLALSIYNFIPSCPICNSRFKLNKGIDILNPHHEGFGNEVVFTTNFDLKKDISYLWGESDNFNIDIDISKVRDERIKNNISLFKLKEIYQSHKDYVKEIIYKKHVYTKLSIEEIKDLFNELNLEDFEIDQVLFGNYLRDEDLYKRPLAKLTKDILESLNKTPM